MHRGIVFRRTIMLACAFVVPQPQRPSPVPQDEALIRQIEREWAEATVHKDAEKLRGILADDFVGNWADGSTTTKAEELAMLVSSKETYQANEIRELRVRVFADVALATGKSNEISVIAGRNATGEYRFMDVFLRRGNRWQLVASQTARAVAYGSRCTE